MSDWIFLDLDGTVLRDDKTVSDETTRALRAVRDLGHHLVFATARPPRSVRRLLPETFHAEYFLCGNGAKLVRGQEVLFNQTIPVAVVQRALDAVRRLFPALRFALEAGDTMVANADLADFDIVYTLVPGLRGPDQACDKVLFVVEDPVDLPRVVALMPAEVSVVPTDAGRLLQIMPQGVTKGTGVARLLADQPEAFSLAFGDDLNDAAMFRAVSWPVAMGNAHPDLKPLAKAVTATNNDHGVAAYLRARYLVELRWAAEPTPDFLALAEQLDADLVARKGCQQEAYHGFNRPVGLERVLVAYDGDRPVACGAYKLRPDGRAEVKRMFVVPSHRGHGLSRRVLAALEASAFEQGYASVVLETSKGFAEANGLYRSGGYRVVDNFEPYVGMPDSVCYQKELGTVLETERLLLRPLGTADEPALALVLSDAAAMAHYPHPFSAAEVHDFVLRQQQRYRDDTFGLWALVRKADGALVGDAGVSWQNIAGERRPEVGYHLIPAFWHQGYATEASRALADWAHRERGFSVVYTWTGVTNLPSQAVARRAGMTEVFHTDNKGIEHVVFERRF